MAPGLPLPIQITKKGGNMKGPKTFFISAVLVAILGTPVFSADYKQGEVIVKFKPASVFMSAESAPTKAYAVAVDDTQKAIAELNARDDVEYAEPNYIIKADEVPLDWPYKTSEWSDVDLPDAWSFVSSNPANAKVRIAVIDSGVDLDHGELKDVLIAGYDFVNDDSEPEDDAGHGTRVTGIIGAKGKDSVKACGVAWNSNIEIMPLKFMKKDGTNTTGYTSDAIDAINYAVNNGVQIINASWGFDTYSRSLEDAINYARGKGVLFVCSAGNNSENNDNVAHYPSNYKIDNIISVAAMNRYGELASFSNYGLYSVHVAAPGSSLTTTDLDNNTTSYASGTSFASPFVVGVAAMVFSENPSISYSEVRSRIIEGSIISASYSDELNMSGGCVNAYNALMGIKNHGIVDNSSWTPPAAASSDGEEASGEDGSKKGCFIETSTNQAASGILFMVLIMMVLFPVFAYRQRG
jgi:subtilisin family serine protease